MRLCTIASGSSGNCILAGTSKTQVLVDAGVSRKRIEEGLSHFGTSLCEISGILITHEHIDHIAGLGVISRKYHIPIYGTKETLLGIRQTKSLGEIDASLFQDIEPEERFQIGDMHIRPFSISHDALRPVAYRLEHQGKSAAVATDLGNYTRETVEALSGVETLLLEANHDIRMLQAGPYPYPLKQRIMGDMGHLSNERSAQLLNQILHDGMKHIFLGHLSKENNLEALAFETVRTEIDMADTPYRAADFDLQVAKRDTPSCWAEW